VTEDCLFCKIVAKEVPSDVVHESDAVLVFRDINPAAPTHVLAIPKEHISSADDLTAAHGALLGELFETLAQVARDADLGGNYRIVTNVGANAGQSVFHLHLHLLGGRSLSWPPG
jgi:histidine triad (HIT) family protein